MQQDNQASVSRILVFFGLTASGKSTLANAYAAKHDLPYYNTDKVRKELAGLAPTTRRPDGIGKGIYTPELSRRTYQSMLDKALADLRKGYRTVLLDGSYSSEMERAEVVDWAQANLAWPVFVFCTCSEAEVKRRLGVRAKDQEAISDGRLEIYEYQLQNFVLPDSIPGATLIRLDTEQKIADLVVTLEKELSIQHVLQEIPSTNPNFS